MDKKQFLKWKEKYWNIYYVEIEDEEFLFRELSRSEYKKGIRLYEDDSCSLEEFICETCILEPKDFDFEECIAGLPTTLSEFILHESGFSEDTGKLNEYMGKYRAEMETLDNQMACIIHEAFQDLNIEDIENWPMEKTIWYYSRAEYILKSLRGVDLVIETADADAKVQTPVVGKGIEQKQASTESPKNNEDRKFEFNLDGDGSMSDFAELGEIQAFMKGKWTPPPETEEGEELL